MKTIYYVLYSIPAACLLTLILIPGSFSSSEIFPMNGGPWDHFRGAVLLVMSFSCPVLVLGGLFAILEALVKRMRVRELLLLEIMAVVPALITMLLIGPVKS